MVNDRKIQGKLAEFKKIEELGLKKFIMEQQSRLNDEDELSQKTEGYGDSSN